MQHPSSIETDVVVVGSGASGLSAALSAAESGARALVLEAGARPGGTSNFPGGLLAVESCVQRAAGIHITKADVFERMMEFNHYRGDAPLVWTIIDRSAATIDWLQAHGVEFLGALSMAKGSLPTWHLIKGAGAALVKALLARCRERATPILLKSPAIRLLRDGGRIAGVVACVEGRETEIRARAVVLASGGYASNAEWMKDYTGYDVQRTIWPAVNVYLGGDSQRMAWDAGAAKDGLGLLEIEFEFNGPGSTGNQLRNVVRQPYLWVNDRGERLGNEDRLCSIPNYGGNVLTRQARKQAFLIFDAQTRRRMETQGYARRGGPPFLDPRPQLVDFDAQLDDAVSAGNPNIFRADSVDALARACGIDHAGLVDTLQAYNRLADDGADSQFGKDNAVLDPVRNGPFYALRITPIMLGTLGGLKVDARLRVLDETDAPIAGLYAVGNIASGMYGDTYCIVFPGTTLAFAVNSGRIAGEHAARLTAPTTACAAR
ncbi:MAG: FAD-dependent oxidoreductase [Proteobacteria bacterium]|nr:FAD-dependent oxidoreductase [Pseudomonadota bacterium]